jgi:dipeptidyl aminopeptidase/acylaminoacyl peptidase
MLSIVSRNASWAAFGLEYLPDIDVLSYRQAKPATNAPTYFPNIVVIQGDQDTNCSVQNVVELVADLKDFVTVRKQRVCRKD